MMVLPIRCWLEFLALLLNQFSPWIQLDSCIVRLSQQLAYELDENGTPLSTFTYQVPRY